MIEALLVNTEHVQGPVRHLGRHVSVRPDLPVDRMHGVIRRMPQRVDPDAEPALLEPVNLLSDKGLRQPRVAFEHKSYGIGTLLPLAAHRARTLDPRVVAAKAEPANVSPAGNGRKNGL